MKIDSTKLAALLEHKGIRLPDLGGNGELPAYCEQCNGRLDFARTSSKKERTKTVLKCRDCGSVVELD